MHTRACSATRVIQKSVERLRVDVNTRVYTLRGAAEWPEGRKDKKGEIIFCVCMCVCPGEGAAFNVSPPQTAQ